MEPQPARLSRSLILNRWNDGLSYHPQSLGIRVGKGEPPAKVGASLDPAQHCAGGRRCQPPLRSFRKPSQCCGHHSLGNRVGLMGVHEP